METCMPPIFGKEEGLSIHHFSMVFHVEVFLCIIFNAPSGAFFISHIK